MAIKEIGAALDRVARNTINDNFKSQDGRIDNLVLQAGDAHPELQDAHYSGVKGQTFATVGKRFDAVEQQAITDKVTANSELQSGLATKRDKSVMLTQADMSTASEAHKLTMNHLSQEVKNMMSGTTPVSPNLSPGQVTTEIIANAGVTIQKLSSDLYNAIAFEQAPSANLEKQAFFSNTKAQNLKAATATNSTLVRYKSTNLFSTTMLSQPFYPEQNNYKGTFIQLKPNTSYRITRFVKDLTGMPRILVNQYANVYSSLGTAYDLNSASEPTAKVLTTGSTGRLYFNAPYLTQVNLLKLTDYIDLMITEATVTPSVYEVGTVEFSDVSGYFIVANTDKHVALTKLGDASTLVDFKLLIPEEDSKQKVFKKDRRRKVLELAAEFAWYGKSRPSVMQGVNHSFTVNGVAGDDFVTVTGGTIAITEITEALRWGAVLKIGTVAKVVNVEKVEHATNKIFIYPNVSETFTAGVLGNVEVDAMHLSKLGYQAYMQKAMTLNDRYTEKERFLGGYIATHGNHEFVKFGTDSGKIFLANDNSNVYENSFRSLYSRNHVSINTSGALDTDFKKTSGILYSKTVDNETGYFEVIVAGRNNTNIVRETGYEFDVEFYVNGSLVEKRTKTTNIVERMCVPFEKANELEVRVVLGKVKPSEMISISSIAFWANDYEWSDTVFPKFTKVAMMFDSWGEFHSGESGKELSRLLNAQSGLTIPFTNNSKGSQTSAWGKAWFYENIEKYNPKVACYDFAINDCNSKDYPLPETVAGPDGTLYNNKLTVDQYKQNMNDLVKQTLAHDITPVIFGGCIGSVLVVDWYLKLLK